VGWKYFPQPPLTGAINAMNNVESVVRFRRHFMFPKLTSIADPCQHHLIRTARSPTSTRPRRLRPERSCSIPRRVGWKRFATPTRANKVASVVVRVNTLSQSTQRSSSLTVYNRGRLRRSAAGRLRWAVNALPSSRQGDSHPGPFTKVGSQISLFEDTDCSDWCGHSLGGLSTPTHLGAAACLSGGRGTFSSISPTFQ
jgi:hypothetical protein